MDDYIKRESVINMLENAQLISNGEYSGYCIEDISIMSIPAADVSPVIHARWINEDFPEENATVNDFAICSACGESSHKAEHGYSILSKYCPYCGARMVGIV